MLKADNPALAEVTPVVSAPAAAVACAVSDDDDADVAVGKWP